MSTTFVVMSSCAKMPQSCRGKYRRVAVVEITAGTAPAMISRRAKGVVRIIETWERLNVGLTDRCAYGRALQEARDLCDSLNARLVTQRFGA